MNIRFRRVHKDATIPAYKTPGAVAFDLAIVEDVSIEPRSFIMARTGLVIEVPEGHALILASRSSNPGKKGIDLANSIGVIDQDYSGPKDEIHLLLENITDETVTLSAGDRVSQGMIIPVIRPTFEEADELALESRGGFGTTGA
ncbi:dUTP diphosphatase [Candidatus Uhrbacteria bacterium]|jgi:dUTP pyrophosphatase|nr:dUTP diphosphatase [Candidatus Uhrbacteria bacterium]